MFTCTQIELGWSQNSFNTPVGFTITLDKIQGMRGEFTVRLTAELILKRGQFSLIMEGSKFTRLIGTGPKNALHKLQIIWTTCFEARKTRKFTDRNQVNHFCHFCITIFAVLKHVDCVKFSSESVRWKVNIELNKHYVGIGSSSGEIISCFGTTLSRVITYRSNNSIKSGPFRTRTISSIFSPL